MSPMPRKPDPIKVCPTCHQRFGRKRYATGQLEDHSSLLRRQFCSDECRRLSLPSLSDRFWTYVDQRGRDECWPWAGSMGSTGYGQINVDRVPRKAHRVSFLLAYGWLPEDVLHKCDNPPCVNPRHLFGGNAAVNMADAARKWRTAGKVTPAVRSTILTLHECGLSQRAIGRQVGINHSSVGRIVRAEVRNAPA